MEVKVYSDQNEVMSISGYMILCMWFDGSHIIASIFVDHGFYPDSSPRPDKETRTKDFMRQVYLLGIYRNPKPHNLFGLSNVVAIETEDFIFFDRGLFFIITTDKNGKPDGLVCNAGPGFNIEDLMAYLIYDYDSPEHQEDDEAGKLAIEKILLEKASVNNNFLAKYIEDTE